MFFGISAAVDAKGAKINHKTKNKTTFLVQKLCSIISNSLQPASIITAHNGSSFPPFDGAQDMLSRE
jgi:hypothetical protein